jgi:hypothetical protein
VGPQQIGKLSDAAEPYVLDKSPDVLSIRRRCVVGGYGYQWLPYSLKPTLTCPDGSVIELISTDCCPYFDDYEPDGHSVAAPAIGKPASDDAPTSPAGAGAKTTILSSPATLTLRAGARTNNLGPLYRLSRRELPCTPTGPIRSSSYCRRSLW